MAEGFLKSFDKRLVVFSAGTQPSSKVHPNAVKVMKQVNIDIKQNYPKPVTNFIFNDFDYVITVCGGANESCPVFTGNVKNKLHIGFDDPAEATGTKEEIMLEFIRIRDEIKHDFKKFYVEQLKPQL
jgi:arsenate reductase